MPTVRLSDILFEDDLLTELKTSNVSLANFLNRPEIIAELVDNITLLTEKDCCDKLLYSRVHAAYISCEILTCGSPEILEALINHPDSLNKILTCLTVQPPSVDKTDGSKTTNATNNIPNQENENNREVVATPPQPEVTETLPNTNTTKPEQDVKEVKNDIAKNNASDKNGNDGEENENQTKSQQDDIPTMSMPPRPKTPMPTSPAPLPPEDKLVMTKVVPQKATLVCKLINTVHSSAAANLSCHITQDISSFSKLISLLVQNIDVSGSFEILSTFIKRTGPPELRYVFCEILSNLNFIFSLIDVMTLSDVEDKQRNACQLLCDIIVIGRQEASEQTNPSPIAQDMLVELLESKHAVQVILSKMFSENTRNSTAIVCGMKVLKILIEQKSKNDATSVIRTIEQTQEEIEKYLIKFHQLLLNPPKQEPIKTTFGVIQKPLGYMRLEVVNLIRALISTNSPNIIKKLVELRTMNVIIDLFINYSWNNLLHTQVEQALCLIINNYRKDEELLYQIDMQQHSHLNSHPNAATDTTNNENGPKQNEIKELDQQLKSEQPTTDVPSRALLSQLLNECDLIGRLLMPNCVTNSSNINDTSSSVISNHNIIKCNSVYHAQDTHNQVLTTNNNNMINSNNINHASVRSVDLSDSDGILRKSRESIDAGDKESKLVNTDPDNKENGNQTVSDDKEENKTVTSVNDKSDSVDNLRRVELERQRRRNGEQANFGHIIQMINSIAINRDLDTIRDHLNEMKERRPELYDRWTTFVNVDVASFKEISLYYDAQSANNNVSHRYGHTQHISNNQGLTDSPNLSHLNSSPDNINSLSNNGDEQFLAYFSFTRETVIPSINVDVLPRLRRPKNAP